MGWYDEYKSELAADEIELQKELATKDAIEQFEYMKICDEKEHWTEEIDVAIDAMKKQLPLKAKIGDGCPRCGFLVSGGSYHEGCGQRIDLA